MKPTQLIAFTQTADEFMAKAKATTNAKASLSYTEAALKWYAKADAIFAELGAKNSILLFVEASAYLGKLGDSYPTYVAFCAANRCVIKPESEFDLVLLEIKKALHAKDGHEGPKSVAGEV